MGGAKMLGGWMVVAKMVGGWMVGAKMVGWPVAGIVGGLLVVV
jgi:hypothetical protein